MVTKVKYTIGDGPKKGIQAKSLFPSYRVNLEDCGIQSLGCGQKAFETETISKHALYQKVTK